jgi:tRNA A-37 threonylcarbamoyl transferase component Bud32
MWEGQDMTGASDPDRTRPAEEAPRACAKESPESSTTDGSTPRPDWVAIALPAVLPQLPGFEVVRELGRGGMGVVYEAVHNVMGRRVAVKLIHPELLRHASTVARFRREVRAAARLAHPNLVTAFSAGQAGECHFLTMELLEGETLAELVRRGGPLPVAQACAYVRQAALGLQHAHESGLVHRDVKPHNLMRTAADTVKVLDFGLAALAGDHPAAGGQTAPHTVMGTADYMAPEQAEDARAADARADVYGLGCTLYHLLTGQAPFPAGTMMQKLLAHRRQAPPSARALRPEVPAALDAVLRRALAKRPGRRFRSAGALAEALRPFTDTDFRPRTRRRVVGLLAVLLLAGLAVTAGVMRLSSDRGREIAIERDAPGGEETVAIDRAPPGVEEKVGQVRRINGGQGLMGRVEFLPDGQLALAAANPVGLWDVRTGQRVRTLPAALGWFNWVAAVSPDGRRALLGTHLWDLATDQELRTLEGGTTKDWVLWDVKFSPDGRRAVFGSHKGPESGTDTVWVCDVETGRLVRRFGNGDGARSVAYAPDGTRIAAGQAPGSDGEPSAIRLYEVETGKELRAFETPTVAASLGFSRDGKQLLSANDRTIRLWDLEGGQELKQFEGHTAPVEWAVLTPDDRRVVSAGGDGTVRVWDVAGSKEVACFRGHTNKVLGVTVSPDGRHALSGSWDGTLRLWRLPDPPALQ